MAAGTAFQQVDARTLSRIPGSTAALLEVAADRPGASRVDEAGQLQQSAPGTARAPLAVAVLQIDSPRPAMGGERQGAWAELWRLTLCQAAAREMVAAARAGLRSDVSFNARGVRLIVSGYGQRLPSLLIALLRRTVRHAAPAAGSAELAAARRVGLRGLERRGRVAGTSSGMGGGRGDGSTETTRAARAHALSTATPELLSSEISALWASVSGAQLLLAGSLGREEAEALSSQVRRELGPLLPSSRRGAGRAAAATDAPPARAAASERVAAERRGLLASVGRALQGADEPLQQWAGLLYKPGWSGSFGAANVCSDPGLAATADECGGV